MVLEALESNMTQEELNDILEQHKLWLDSEGEEGKKADSRGADFSFDNLTGADLRDSDLEGIDLRAVDLGYTNLVNANLESIGVYFFKGPKHMGIYDSKYNRLHIGCKVHTLDYWLQNYIDIGKEHEYTDEEIVVYGAWIKSLKEIE